MPTPGPQAPVGLGFQELTPQEVLDALDAVGRRGDGRILQLNSYENRVFQVCLEDGSVVVAKFYRPGRWSDAQILEEHAYALELAAAEVPVVPPLPLHAEPAGAPGRPALVLAGSPPTLAHYGRFRFALAARHAGREPELEAPEVLPQIGRFIGRLHAVGARRPFVHRHRLDAYADGRLAIERLTAGGFVAAPQLLAWCDAAERALAALAAAFERLQPLATLRLHGDFHIGNLLWRPAAFEAAGVAGTAGAGRAHLVDLDDAMQGPAVQDLWMLVSGDPAFMARQFNALLEGYEQFREFDDRERALIEPLRTLRMLRHSAWLAERWQDPTFPIHFPFFGTGAYWSQQTAQLREQLELMGA